MKNKIFLLLAMFVSACTQVHESKTIEERVTMLETNLSAYEIILSILGVSVVGAIPILFYVYKSFKKNLDEKAQKIIEQRADTILEQKFKNHPAFAQYEKEQKAKTKSIFVVVSEDSQNRDLNDLLTDKGFTDVKFFPVNIAADKIRETKEEGKINFLILFNNEQGELQQSQIDKIANEHKGNIQMFYYNTTEVRFKNPAVTMAGFANSKETLVKRLLEALQ